MSRRTRNRSLLLLGVLGAAVGGFVLVGHQPSASADITQADEAEPTQAKKDPKPTSKERQKAAEQGLLDRSAKARKKLEKMRDKMAQEGNDVLADRMTRKLADLDAMVEEHEDKLAELEE